MTTFRPQIYIYSETSGNVGTQEMKLELWFDITKKRIYPFNITFTANTPPYFASTLTTAYVNIGTGSNITLPAITDDEGDPAYYDLNPPSGLPFNVGINGKRI